MEVMGIMGFTIGSAGMTFALITMAQLGGVKQELDDLKQQLIDAGTIVANESDDAASDSQDCRRVQSDSEQFLKNQNDDATYLNTTPCFFAGGNLAQGIR